MHLKTTHQKEIVIKKSRFIGYVAPCFSEEEARDFIESINQLHRDATHVCTAFVVGENDQIQRSNDNHEPSGTAGMPMLEALKNIGMHNTVACVVRYFGGIKLGASGLIRAYSSSVSETLKECDKFEFEKIQKYRIDYPYDLCGSLDHYLHTTVTIEETTYDEMVHVTFLTQNENLYQEIQDLSKGQVEPVYLGDEDLEIKVEDGILDA